MPNIESLGELIETDVLVIGGGISGLWVANRAKEFVNDVLLVDNGPQDWGGAGARAGGDFDAVLPDEDVDDFVKDLVYYYDGLCDQDMVEQIFAQSYHRLEDYERLGHTFVRGEDGKLRGIPQRGLEHIKCYIHRPYGKGGKSMVRVLVEEANRLGVRRISRTYVTGLLHNNGAVVGATAFNIRNGDFFIFKASAVVLASGETGVSISAPLGDSIDMALKAGAEVNNCEFLRVWNFPKLFAWEGQTLLLPLGARFVNAEGETFMDKYSPVLRNNTDPHYNTLGMSFEAREGRAPFYLDCSAMKPEDIEITRPGDGWQKLNYDKLIEEGMNFFKDKIEWTPQPVYSCEGIMVDKNGDTGVPGLFAAGTVCTIMPGVYMGGWNLCRTAVTGYIVGESAANYARSHTPLQIREEEVELLKNSSFAALGKEGITPDEVMLKVQGTIFPYDVCLIKSDASLKGALREVEAIKNELVPRMAAKDTHYLMRLTGARSMANMAERYLRTSLMRTETRAGHYREDYPARDNNNWLKWIVVTQDGGDLRFRTESVPVERYKFKPTRYYMDNFRFP